MSTGKRPFATDPLISSLLQMLTEKTCFIMALYCVFPDQVVSEYPLNPTVFVNRTITTALFTYNLYDYESASVHTCSSIFSDKGFT